MKAYHVTRSEVLVRTGVVLTEDEYHATEVFSNTLEEETHLSENQIKIYSDETDEVTQVEEVMPNSEVEPHDFNTHLDLRPHKNCVNYTPQRR